MDAGVCSLQTGCIKLYIVNVFKRGERQNEKNVEMFGGQKAMTVYQL